MECNRDEAARAKEIADTKLGNQDIPGAKKFALKAQCLYPQLDGLSQLMATIDMFVSAENKVGGEVDWYGVLGVSPVAEDETVKKQYKKLALVLHPDKNKSPGADDAFKLISEAWSLLSDKSKRLAYNQRRFPRGFTQSSPIRTNSSPTAHQHRQQQNSNNHSPAASGSSFPAGGNAKNSNNHAPTGSSFPAGRNAKNSNNHAPAAARFLLEEKMPRIRIIMLPRPARFLQKEMLRIRIIMLPRPARFLQEEMPIIRIIMLLRAARFLPEEKMPRIRIIMLPRAARFLPEEKMPRIRIIMLPRAARFLPKEMPRIRIIMLLWEEMPILHPKAQVLDQPGFIRLSILLACGSQKLCKRGKCCSCLCCLAIKWLSFYY